MWHPEPESREMSESVQLTLCFPCYLSAQDPSLQDTLVPLQGGPFCLRSFWSHLRVSFHGNSKSSQIDSAV